jgi:hypothetical protein
MQAQVRHTKPYLAAYSKSVLTLGERLPRGHVHASAAGMLGQRQTVSSLHGWGIQGERGKKEGIHAINCVASRGKSCSGK